MMLFPKSHLMIFILSILNSDAFVNHIPISHRELYEYNLALKVASKDGIQPNLMELEETDDEIEPMFGINYDPLEPPNDITQARDLEDYIMERGLRFKPNALVKEEKCYLVGLEDKSREFMENVDFSLEESLSELSELAGAAGLLVVGSTFQRVARPSIEYFIGPGKVKEIAKSMKRLKCRCVIFDTELSPSQQKNLELSLNQENSQKGSGGGSGNQIKVIDRTALILDIFAQHARSREGQLQVQLALLSYRLPRLTNMWTHLERQSAGARGKSNGGVGLRGPGEKQLESDRRQMKSKIALLKVAIDSVRRHRALHRGRRRRMGSPVVALVGYTNAGKSCLLNQMAGSAGGVFCADMLFATLDPTTRLVQLSGTNQTLPDLLVTDTVGFIQRLPTNLVAAFRATLEELFEADILLHVTDVSNPSWRKQQAAVLKELADMGLTEKPLVTFWNKVDTLPAQKEFLKLEASKRVATVCGSAVTGEGLEELVGKVVHSLSASMVPIDARIPHDKLHEQDAGGSGGALLNAVYRLGSMEKVSFEETATVIRGLVPQFLGRQIESFVAEFGRSCQDDTNDEDDVDRIANEGTSAEEEEAYWKELARGRHRARIPGS